MTNKRKIRISMAVIAFLLIGYFVADAWLFDGVRPKAITENGFQADLFVKDDVNNKTAIVLIGGGPWGDYWANEFAKNKMVGLSLPYVYEENLPKLPEKIDLVYFKNALQWLGQLAEVDPDKIIVMGASRNAELALLIASKFPEIVSGVIAYAPSSVSWSNSVLPYNSDTLKASWTYKGTDIPYVPTEKITPNNADKIEMLAYWEKGLSKIDFVNKALIKVEQIRGPILLFSGIDDEVWPSAKMANMIEQRLAENNFKPHFSNIKYKDAGHSISTNPEQISDVRTGKIRIKGKNYTYDFGGTN
ncbi:MAG TPA: palmitoyl-CoA hydrolase [Pricia sp.]|nr:palmitoyl-CoA hydrolase [Pricia sp.]